LNSSPILKDDTTNPIVELDRSFICQGSNNISADEEFHIISLKDI